MPRVGKSSRYSENKTKAVNELKKVELKEKIEEKTSQKKEITDNMRIEMNNHSETNPKNMQSNRRYQDLKVQRNSANDEIIELNSELDSIRNPLPEKRDSVLNAGISITENPFDEERRETTPITAQGGVEGWSLSQNTQFLTGQNSFSFNEDKEEILRRRDGRSQSNMQNIVDPMSKPRLNVQGREPQPMTTDEYQEEERRILHNEQLVANQIERDRVLQQGRINPRAYYENEIQSNPIISTLQGIDQVSRGFEGISQDGVNQQNFGEANNGVNRLQNAFLSNLALSTINRPTSTFNQKKEEEKPKSVRVNSEDELPRFGDSVSNAEMQSGLFVQGMSQTFGSYSNMIQNAYNFATGKEHVPMKERDMPVQDVAFGGLIKSFQDSQSFNVPFSVALQDNYQTYQKKNVPLAKQVGNLAVEGVMMALPIPIFGIARGIGQAVKHGSKLGDSFASRMFDGIFNFGGKETKEIAKIINKEKASTTNPKSLENVKNSNDSILLQGSEATETYFPANIITPSKKTLRGQTKSGQVTSYTSPETMKDLGITNLDQIKVLGTIENPLAKNLGLKQITKTKKPSRWNQFRNKPKPKEENFYINNNPTTNEIAQFAMNVEAGVLKPTAIGRKYSSKEVTQYPKTFEQYYSKPFDSAPTTPKGDTVIYTTKDFGLTQEPIKKMNWYSKFFPQHETPAIKELDNLSKGKINSGKTKPNEIAPETKSNQKTTQTKSDNKQVKEVVKKVSELENRPKPTSQLTQGIGLSFGLVAPFAKGISGNNFKLETNPQMINFQVLSGSQGLSDMIGFDFVTGVKQQQNQASSLKQIAPTILDNTLIQNPIQQTRPILKPMQTLFPMFQSATTPATATRPWFPFLPMISGEEKRRRFRRRKGRRVQKKKADWFVPEQTPFKILAPSSKSGGNYQYWGKSSDKKQLGMGWY